jgi:prolyl 4-hydroxylase
MKSNEPAIGIATIDGVLNPEECGALITRVEAIGFDVASINSRHGAVVDENVRNNDRVIVDDFGLAGDFWSRVDSVIPKFHSARQVRGLNERIRFYRYKPGQSFKWHIDGAFRRDNGDASLFTFMIYLNEGYQGGETAFRTTRVAGKMGMALMFEHDLMHEGSAVTSGLKYGLRTDIMYGPVGQVAG